MRLEGRGDFDQPDCPTCVQQLLPGAAPGYRCEDCDDCALYCKECITQQHQQHPLHRLKVRTARDPYRTSLIGVHVRVVAGMDWVSL